MALVRRAWQVKATLAIMAASLAATATAAPSKAPPVIFADKWIDGTAASEPETQVQAIDADTFVIRQSIKTNFEAPFLYLLFGRDKALLIDSGADAKGIRPTVDRLISERLKAHRKDRLPLIVAHSHSHGDHIAADAIFRARPDTVVVGLEPADVAAFFAIKTWPQDIAAFDLGGRTLSIIPTPGHQAAHIMVYDAKTQILFSGDALYPGRLYVPVNFMADERASVDRLAKFAATHPIRAALGAHIEMTTTPGQDYVQAAQAHPAEHRLELDAATIQTLQQGLKQPIETQWHAQIHDDFIVYPVPPRRR